MRATFRRLIPSPKSFVPNPGTLIVVGLLFFAQTVGALPSAAPAQPLAASPAVISYQGSLTDQSGNPLNQNVTMEFSLYDVPADGSLLWGPETQSVEVSNGLFHVLLGSVTPIDWTRLSGAMYLDIKVNGERLSPRELLASVAYAIEAKTLPDYAETRGRLWVNGSLSVRSPDKGMYSMSLVRTDEDNRIHKWHLWHMDQANGKNSFQIWEYRTDSNGKDCGGDPALGAICNPRFTINQGGNISVGGHLSLNGRNLDKAGNVSGSGTQQIHMPASNPNIYLNWQKGANVYFGGGDGKADVIVTSNGIDMQGNSVSNCGALTEANLQTEAELAAGRIERFEEGDVLCWGDGQLEKCDHRADPLIQAVANGEGLPIVIGAEPVKVVGPVKKGDFLVASDTPGYAMATGEPAFGTVIAQALEDFDGDQGVVKAMIRKM